MSGRHSGYNDGRKPKKLREDGMRLEAALPIAFKHIALHAMQIPPDGELAKDLVKDSEVLDAITDLDLPYGMALPLGRLRASTNEYEEDDEVMKTAKKKKCASDKGSADKGSGGKGSGGKASGGR